MIGNLENGSRVGRFVWWHQNGVKQSMGNYDAKGRKTGQWIWWHENGMKSIMGQYKQEFADGLWRQWDQDGRQTREKTFDAVAQAKADAETSIDLFAQEDADINQSTDFEMTEDENVKSMLQDGDADLDSNYDGESGSQGTDSLENISPAEIEGEELPSPESSGVGDTSANSLQPARQTTQEDVDQFFQISF